MSQDLDLIQSMSFFSITGTSGNKEQQLKLPSLPKNEGQFTLWRIKVESTIHGAGLMDYITHEKTKLYSRALDRLNNYRREQNKDEEKVHLDELPEQQKEAVDNRRFKVYAALAETLTTAEQNRILLNVKDHPVGDAYKLWMAITEKYSVRTSDANKEKLWELFNGLKMDQKEDYRGFKARVEEAVANLITVGEVVPETRIKAKVIAGLATKYYPFVGGLYTTNYEDMTLSELSKKVKDFEESTVFKTIGTEQEFNQGMVALVEDQKKWKTQQKKGRNPKIQNAIEKKLCFTCGKPNHQAFDCYANKDKKKCSNCRKIGHTDSECRNPKRNKKVGNGKEERKSEEDFGYYFATVLPQANTTVINRDTWILDSGATKHLCTNLQQLTNIRTPDEGIQMKVANEQRVSLKRMGTTKIKFKEGEGLKSGLVLRDVVHAPTFSCNLISVGQLSDAGLEVKFNQHGAVVLTPSGQRLFTAKRVGSLYVVPTKPNKRSARQEQSFSVTEQTKNQSELWHCRLAHIGHKALRNMVLNNSVTGLNITEEFTKPKNCESCLMGKQHRHPFANESRDKAENIMDKAHADLCGPVQPTRNGELYLSTIIDERSRLIFGELLKAKSDAADGIMKWCMRAKTSTGKTLKVFHSDGGGEYKGSKLLKFFAGEGIEKRSTLPSTPQHNGIAERANRTLFEAARTMLSHARLPQEFWGDAVLHAIYIRNRCLTTADKVKTPYELFYGTKPDISHIRVFGCDAYMHVKDNDRAKMESKSSKCILLGYSEYYQGYKLYSLQHKKVRFSRDVNFNEESFRHGQLLQQEAKNSETISTTETDSQVEVDSDADVQEVDQGILDHFPPVASTAVESVEEVDIEQKYEQDDSENSSTPGNEIENEEAATSEEESTESSESSSETTTNTTALVPLSNPVKMTKELKNLQADMNYGYTGTRNVE
jgi:hypothetical protein